MSGTTMTTTERVYVLLREAAELIHHSGTGRSPVLDFSVASMELQALAFVERHIDIGEGDYPDSVEECVSQAATETLNWDLDELPVEAAQFVLNLSDLQRELASQE